MLMKKKFTKWSMALALLAMTLLLPLQATAKTLYLDAGGSSKWDQGGAWFSAWVWGSAKGDAWYKATKGAVYYEIDVPDDATGMLWVRFSKVATKESWTQANGDTDGYWNKTGDLTIGKDNLLTIKGWGTKLGTDYAWSTYVAPTPDPVITVGAAPEFATTTVGETSSATVTYTLENADKAEATIEGEGFSIAEQSVGSVTITFAPEAEGEYTGTLTITSGDVKETVAVKATAVAPEAPKVPEILHVSAAEFAEIMEGETTSVTVTYELVNAEEATATVEGEGFAITAQETGSVTIEFAPATAGEYTGKLIIAAGEVVKELALAATAKAPIPVITIKVSAPADWATCYIWAWTGTGTNLFTEAWPGKAMTKGDDGFYAIDIETDKTINLLVSDNGQDSKKTADYTVGVTESTCFIIQNKTLVVNEECEFEVAPEPEPIEPYYAIRGLGAGLDPWAAQDEIKLTYNAEGGQGEEWFINNLVITEGQQFKVVYVDETGVVCGECWYGLTSVEINSDLVINEEEDDITLAAGKYDLYFKVANTSMWIAPVTEQGGDEPGEGGEEPGEPEGPDPEQPEPEDPAANTITIKVAAPWENCNLYAWTGEGETSVTVSAPWPGTAMTKGEDGFYTLDVEIPGAINIIANNGTAQTGDYTAGVTESTCFNVENNTLVVNETCTYVEPTLPEPYYGIRGLDGTWNVANDVKLTYKADGEQGEEWYITGLEVDGTQEFKVVYVDAAGATCDNCWYGVAAVESNAALGEIGTDNIILAAGKYDLYFKVANKSMWIAPVTEQGGDEPGEGGEEPGEPEGPDTPVIPEEPAELEFALVGRLNGSDDEILAFEDGYKFTKESEFVYTVNVTFTGAAVSGNNNVQKVKLVDAEGNIWARKSSKTIKPGDGTSTMTLGETASSTYFVTEIGVEYKITYTLVSDPAEALYKQSGQITFEKVETPVGPDPELPEPEDPDTPVVPEPEPEFPKTITIKVAAAWDNCNLYAWTQEGETTVIVSASWPGSEMTKGEDGFYTLDIEIPGSVNLIANNGSAQSGDYTVGVTESTCFNVEDNTLVINETCTYVEPTIPEAYYGIRGLDGIWNVANDIKLTYNAEGSQGEEWYITGLEVDGTQEFKVVYVDAAGATCDNCWYGVAAVESNAALGEIGTDNIILAAGKYDLYFKVATKSMWIQHSEQGPSTDAEEAITELIYAIDGNIYAPAPFAIIDLAGKDVTKANGALKGAYIVKTQNSVTKVLVK